MLILYIELWAICLYKRCNVKYNLLETFQVWENGSQEIWRINMDLYEKSLFSWKF